MAPTRPIQVSAASSALHTGTASSGARPTSSTTSMAFSRQRTPPRCRAMASAPQRTMTPSAATLSLSTGCASGRTPVRARSCRVCSSATPVRGRSSMPPSTCRPIRTSSSRREPVTSRRRMFHGPLLLQSRARRSTARTPSTSSTAPLSRRPTAARQRSSVSMFPPYFPSVRRPSRSRSILRQSLQTTATAPVRTRPSRSLLQASWRTTLTPTAIR